MKSTSRMLEALLGWILLLVFVLVGQAGAQTWTQLSPIADPTYGTPSPRILNSTVYNTANKRLIVFAGGGAGGYGILNDVWVLSNADGSGTPAWTKLNPTGGPPGAREGHIAVYDQANNRMIIQGGYITPGDCEGVISDVWVLTNADGTGGTPAWTQLLPTGTAPARRFAGAAYDAFNNRLMINGGGNSGCGAGLNSTFVLSNANGLGGTPAWTQLAPTAPVNFPSDTSGGNTGYDPATNTFIRFLEIQGYISTWLLSNGNGSGGTPVWQELAVSPPPVLSNWSGGNGVYDPGTNKFVFFGKSTVSGYSETWTLANANGVGTAQWTQLSPMGTLPDARDWSFAGYAPGTDRLTIYGGSKDGWNGTNEVWVLTNANRIVTPVANAGSGQTVHVGLQMSLDGSGSSDPGGGTLTYLWSFDSKPAGSGASLSNPTIVNPTFTPDVPGDYVLRLIVTNNAGTASSPSTVTISTTNSPPVADAGPDQSITVIGTNVQLNGGQSYDPGGDPLNFNWSFPSKPAGSTASLIGANTATPSFIADVHGTYVAQLVVSDPWAFSQPSTVTISFEELKPVANAQQSMSIPVGTVAMLDGSGSYDANRDPLTYKWTFVSLPANSQSVISSPTASLASFIPDLPGTYIAQLIVNDGIINSDPSTVQFQVFSTESAAITSATDIQASVSSIPVLALKNATMKKTFLNKLNAAIASIDAGLYADALDQLKNDILGKTDGCATTGAPDKNDWITTCPEQNQVYPLILETIWIVEGLLPQ